MPCLVAGNAGHVIAAMTQFRQFGCRQRVERRRKLTAGDFVSSV
jgi:hypothetical protein